MKKFLRWILKHCQHPRRAVRTNPRTGKRWCGNCGRQL